MTVTTIETYIPAIVVLVVLVILVIFIAIKKKRRPSALVIVSLLFVVLGIMSSDNRLVCLFFTALGVWGCVVGILVSLKIRL
jgi:hypothetical protein